jgi:hypothetical protein
MSMIIQQKIICLHYLLAGNNLIHKKTHMKTSLKTLEFYLILIGMIIFTVSACDDISQISYNLKTNFIYKNLTSEDLELILYDQENTKFQTYSIPPNKEIKVVISGDGPKTGISTPFNMRSDSRYIAKKVVVKFTTSNKCLSFSEMEGMLDVKKYDNFSESMYNTSNNTLIYNIDQTELNLAISCP